MKPKKTPSDSLDTELDVESEGKRLHFNSTEDYNRWYRHTYLGHSDYEWVNKKIDGHGGSMMYDYKDPLSRMKIGYIGSKSKFTVFIYNCILTARWIIRNLKNR